MKRDSVKTSKILGRKSKARLVDWVARESSRGTRYAQVELSASKSQPVLPTRGSGTARIKNDEPRLHMPPTAPSMDVDEILWTEEQAEEPVLPKKKRASSPAFASSTILDIFLS
jgi:hypothetical protein